MADLKSLVALKILLQDNDGKILILEARHDGLESGFYDLPGGKINDTEQGKEPPEIIQREVNEELGNIQYELDLRPLTIVNWVWPDNNVIFIYYRAKYISGEVNISNEHLSYKWVELNKEVIDKNFTSHHHKALTTIIN